MKHLLHHVIYNFILQKGVSMSIVAQVSNIMQELFHASVNQKVQELGIVQRIRKLPYALFIQTLVCGWFEKPDASYADLVADWYIFITNVDATRLSVEQIAAIIRIQWQVELLFKCFKAKIQNVI